MTPLNENKALVIFNSLPHIKKADNKVLKAPPNPPETLKNRFCSALANFFGVAYNPHKENLQQKIFDETQGLKAELKVLTNKIKFLYNFIRDKDDLRGLCITHMQQYSSYIAKISITPFEEATSNLDMLLQLKIQACEYRHFLNESELFIQRHEEVYDCFVKTVKSLHPTQDLVIDPKHCLEILWPLQPITSVTVKEEII